MTPAEDPGSPHGVEESFAAVTSHWRRTSFSFESEGVLEVAQKIE